jgi:putative tricarboxylic transport membrane protein
MMSTDDHQAAPRRIAIPELLIGLGTLAAAGAVLWQTFAIPVSPLYSKVGPTVFPYITAAGMLVLSVLLVVAALQGGWQPAEEKETPTDWKSMIFVVAGLLANLFLIQPLGFTAASVIMFVLVCYGFGSRHPVRDFITGLILALAAYFGFAKALGVNIGAGYVENFANSIILAITGGLGG